ncbi:hypothetical protein CPB86DRAFT_872099 [Serendipita vermifera]|nr:hypothetical protein CPB86DRAFT_872099 [Serendipita vermifera]
MSQSRGNPPGRSSYARPRGGRNRGKASRARGSARGLRIPPEYLAQVIAQREGRDPNDIDHEDLDEEELAEFQAKYAKRPILEATETADNEQQELDETVDKEDENVNEILQRYRQKLAQGEEDPMEGSSTHPPTQDNAYPEDVDHALGASLRALSARSRGHGNSMVKDGHVDTESKVIQIEWNEELEEMRRESAEAEARNDLKQRFKSRGTGTSDHIRKKTATIPLSKAHENKPEMQDLEGFLDDLLN